MRGKQTLKTFEHTCHERGLRVTPQRTEIFREVIRHAEHPSAEEIFTRIRNRMPSTSLDTVYRTLNSFAELGLVVRFQALDGRYRYDINLDKHHHLVCRNCHQVMDFAWPAIDRLPTPTPHGWENLEVQHVQLLGICASCSGKTRRKKISSHEQLCILPKQLKT